MIWVALLGSALGIINNSHVAVDILVDKLSKDKKKIATIFIYIMMMSLFLIFLFYGIKLSNQAMNQRSPSMRWLKMGFIMASVPLTGVLGIVNIIAMIKDSLKD